LAQSAAPLPRGGRTHFWTPVSRQAETGVAADPPLAVRLYAGDLDLRTPVEPGWGNLGTALRPPAPVRPV